MATDQSKTRFPLKLLVDERRNRVVVAEGSKDFVDVLFSFLTMPMGTIVRITKPEENQSGMYHLYQSVKDLGDSNFSTEFRKSSLIYPRNPCEENCLKLKVKIDDSIPDKYYSCSGCSSTSFNSNETCRCGWTFQYERCFSSQRNTKSHDVFLKGGTMFILSDDLQVMPSSPSSLVQHLSSLGITDMTQVKKISMEAGIEEIASLIKCSMISKSALTDVFLVKLGKSNKFFMPDARSNLVNPPCSQVQKGDSSGQLSLKVVIRKSTNRILYAEACDDFVDFLFSFLTIPLGTLIKLLDGQTGLQCINNLYKSVEDLESKWLCVEKNTLLNAGVAIYYDYWKHPLGIQTRRLGRGAREQILCGRFMKTPSKFLVTDKLTVTDLSSTSCIGFLEGLNVPFCDIEQKMVTISEAEALSFLKASLTSSSPLTDGLNPVIKEETLS